MEPVLTERALYHILLGVRVRIHALLRAEETRKVLVVLVPRVQRVLFLK